VPRTLLSILLACAIIGPASAQRANPPVYVTLWFDTEDYLLPQDDDAAKRLAELLTRLGVRATFKIVGEKARVLEARGRRDVVTALARHDIGYHANTHSQPPTIAVYLQHAGWDEGRAEFVRREGPGVRDVQRIFGVTPVAYGQPGSAWAPQSYPALRDLGVRMYLDEADHVGIDDQPFYYGGLLNVFKMRSNLARMDLHGGDSLARGKATFTAALDRLRQNGGGTISIYYHPNEWVQTEFWDAVNFSRGRNPPKAEWKLPGTRPAAETEQAFQDFEAYVRFIMAQPGVRFVTATELLTIYADKAATHRVPREELARIARAARQEVTFQRFDGYALSAAEIFGVLTDAADAFIERKQVPADTPVKALDGPTRRFEPAAGSRPPASVPWAAFAATVRDVAAYQHTFHRVPDEIWMGSDNLSPADYLATLAAVVDGLVGSGTPPSAVARVEGRYTADRYVADDSPELWSWPIFPEGFHAPHLMELARLQAWTLKPALLP